VKQRAEKASGMRPKPKTSVAIGPAGPWTRSLRVDARHRVERQISTGATQVPAPSAACSASAGGCRR
jgi:hypothetical protein